MELIRNIFLMIHVFTGMSALLFGLIAMVTKKGSNKHKNAGSIFYWSMIFVAITALFLSIINESIFLFSIGIFSYFMTHFGRRMVINKSLKASLSDWIILSIATLNSILMIITFSIVLTIFGVISLLLALDLARAFVKSNRNSNIPKNEWLRQHIGLMIGAYISTITAFLVVNFQAMPYKWIIWLLPTAVFSPLIAYWQIKTNSKKKKSPRLSSS